MLTHHRSTFTTIRTEGAILPADLLQRIAEGDASLGGLTPEAYHLAAGEKINEAINRAWNRCLGAWATFQSAAAKLPENDLGTSITRERWLLPLFQELGYGRLMPAKAIEIEEGAGSPRPYPISHGWQNTPIHLVGLKVDLDRRTPGVAGASRSSPHSLVQELLNRSSEHLWAIVSNGLRLRVLRDNARLTRQAYVEFDLQAMMDGEVYADFALLWLVGHQSRFEVGAGEATSPLLEKWMKAAQDQGTRALDQLRGGVEAAITALGTGFITPTSNRALREKLQSGELSAQEFYRQLQRMVYRLIFLFTAEERGLLLDPKAGAVAQERYTRYYSIGRLRRLAERRSGTRHVDLHHGLRLVMDHLGGDGCPELALPALGSDLFNNEFIRDLEGCEIANRAVLDAIRALAFIQSKGVRRLIDYKNLGSQEWGSVYTSLLELHPILNLDAGTFELQSAAGNERKTTGSYYTEPGLVNELVESALEPVIADRLSRARTREEKERALLSIRVLDSASGSGHMLLAAGHRLARHLAIIRSGDEEPSPEALRTALRDVIGHCLYGVDSNPMAVELCKVNLWMEALEPGKPLSFLDHHIKCGNSLIGATPALLAGGIPDEAFTPIAGDDKAVCSAFKKKNKTERAGQLSYFDAALQPWERVGDIAASLLQVDELADDTIEGVRRKQARYAEVVRSSGYEYGRLWADSWCAAFVWKKTKEFPYPITEEVFRRIEHNPFDLAPWMREEIERLAEQYQFFHWHLEFPEVFKPAPIPDPAERTGWEGGFDVEISNPPWEKIKLQEREWFATRRPDIASAQNSAIRKRMIDELVIQDPNLHHEFTEAKRESEGESHFLKNSGLFLLGASGDTNTYPLFIELAESLGKDSGRIGLIVKTGILADYSMKDFFVHLVESHRLVSAYDFSNKRQIFPAVVANERFTLLTLGGYDTTQEFRVSILNEDIADLKIPERIWSLSVADLPLINPNTRTCPLFRTSKDSEVVRKVYERLPVLINESPDKQSNPWQCAYYTMFHMTNDSNLFSDLETLERLVRTVPSPDWQGNGFCYLALFEGKLFDIFDYQHGTFAGVPRDNRFGIKAEPNHLNEASRADPAFECLPRYWVPAEEVQMRYQEKLGYIPSAVLAFRDVCRTHTDLRTVRASIIPAWGFGNKAPLLIFPGCSKEEHSKSSLSLCSNLTSFVFDYISRQKFAGGSLNRYILIQLPIIAPTTAACPWSQSESVFDWLNARALELTYTTWALQPFARDCGYHGPPFVWNEERRFMIRCELDAAYFHLYGIAHHDVDYIMETFPILRRRDEEAYSEYRTKQVILDFYDAMGEAMRTEQPYLTRLDPQPADLRVAHPPNGPK